jgi:site-specific DNA-methyltransferase (adenine-specific)
MKFERFDDGVAICGDSTSEEVVSFVKTIVDKVHVVCTDPPYGNILRHGWDRWSGTQSEFVDWMISWTKSYSNLLVPQGAMYVWGGYGVAGFRPFFEYASRIESESDMNVSNLITWSKKRAYGVQHNYLSTREELLYMIKGDIKKPAVFNVPLLETKRGYAGYNAKYPAKSEFYRRTNVWMDVNELFSGKVHPTQKPTKIFEIPIEVNTNQGDWVIDPFAGSGVAAFAARKLGRKFIAIEQDEGHYGRFVEKLSSGIVDEEK